MSTEKVFAVYSGCIYEGGGVDRIYKNQEDAVRYATQMFVERNEESKRIHSDKPEEWAWYEVEEIPVISSRVKHWKNLVDEIIVYEYKLL